MTVCWSCSTCDIFWKTGMTPRAYLPPPSVACPRCDAVLLPCVTLGSADCGDFRVQVVAEWV